MTANTADLIQTIIQRLRQTYPDAHCELNYETPHQLLVATILSAQCTDERVNRVTPELFSRYPDPAAFAAADRAELEEAVRSTGFYRQKAKYIQESSFTILHAYGGEVPADMKQPAPAKWCSPQNGQRRTGRNLRYRRRDYRGYACQAPGQTSRAHR